MWRVMVAQRQRADSFTEFVAVHEEQLCQALSAACGDQVGRDAAAEALMSAWEHWDRVKGLDNPAGYLYRVGKRRGRRMLRRRRPVYEPVPAARFPDVEPKLPNALSRLSERQRTVVVLIHCDEWSQGEVAQFLGLSRSAVRNHLERGMKSLRSSLGGVT